MGSLECTIHLDKKSGVKVTLLDADGGVTQTVALDGTTLTLTVEGKGGKSSLVQSAEGISITCGTFKVKADEVTIETGKQGITLAATGALALSSKGQVTMKGMSVAVSSQGTLGLESSGVATLKGAVTNVQGQLVKLG